MENESSDGEIAKWRSVVLKRQTEIEKERGKDDSIELECNLYLAIWEPPKHVVYGPF